MATWTARSLTLVFLLLLSPCLFSPLQSLSFFPGHSEVAFASSEAPGTPGKHGSSAFEVDDDLCAIDFAVVGVFVGGYEVILGVKFDESVASGFSLSIADDPYRFYDTVFLQIH